MYYLYTVNLPLIKSLQLLFLIMKINMAQEFVVLRHVVVNSPNDVILYHLDSDNLDLNITLSTNY